MQTQTLVSAPAHAGAEDTSRSLLRMAVGDELLAVPIEQVREILQVTRMTPLPRTPAFVRGVMNLRGSVVPVIDLAARLDLPPTVIGRRSCVVVVQMDAEVEDDEGGTAPVAMGLLVDAVFEVFERAGGDIEPAPAIGTQVPPQHLLGMTRASGQLVGVLELRRVLATPDLAACIAGFRPH